MSDEFNDTNEDDTPVIRRTPIRFGFGPVCNGFQFTIETSAGPYTARRCAWDRDITPIADMCPMCGWPTRDVVCQDVSVIPASACLIYIHDSRYPFWQLIQLPDNSQPIDKEPV